MPWFRAALTMPITIEEFGKVEMKVARIIAVDDIPQARKPMYRLTLDFGDGITKQCVGGIKPFYSPEQLKGRQVVAVTNLQPKIVAGVVSECMMLAAFNESDVSLLKPDKEMPLGTKVG